MLKVRINVHASNPLQSYISLSIIIQNITNVEVFQVIAIIHIATHAIAGLLVDAAGQATNARRKQVSKTRGTIIVAL